MTIFNDSLESFDCQPNENDSILAEELNDIFDCMPESRLAGKLGLDRWVGRSGYPIQVMLRAYLASYFLNLRNTNGLIRRLQEDMILREICGFDRTRPLPDRRTFNRFIDRVELHIDIIEWFIDQVVSRLYDLLPSFGTVVAIDATDVHSHSNYDKKPVSEIEAGFAIKEGAVGQEPEWKSLYTWDTECINIKVKHGAITPQPTSSHHTAGGSDLKRWSTLLVDRRKQAHFWLAGKSFPKLPKSFRNIDIEGFDYLILIRLTRVVGIGCHLCKVKNICPNLLGYLTHEFVHIVEYEQSRKILPEKAEEYSRYVFSLLKEIFSAELSIVERVEAGFNLQGSLNNLMK